MKLIKIELKIIKAHRGEKGMKIIILKNNNLLTASLSLLRPSLSFQQFFELKSYDYE